MEYDVVVVGAGPAGSTAARCLAEKGINVLLLDKQKFPRDKPCGGGLPTKVLKRFPYVEQFLNSISYGSITHSSSLKYVFEFERDEPLIAMVLRSKFDQNLVDIAVKKGATFRDAVQVTDMTIQNKKVILTLDNKKTIDAKIVLGCDGMRSIIAEKANLSEKTTDFCVCLEQEESMSEKQIDSAFTKKRMIHLFMKTQGIAGYGWIFPKKTHVNVGIGEFESAFDKSKPRKSLKESYDAYVKMLQEQKLLPKSFDSTNAKGGIIPVFPLQKTYADRVLLCGDSAGFINPITGEGIYYAMTSGEIAADVTIEALKQGDFSEDFLSIYQKRWKKDFGRELRRLGQFNNQWGKSTEKFVRLLSKDRIFAKLMIGITGGQLNFSKYWFMLLLRYVYASIKDLSKGKKQ